MSALRVVSGLCLHFYDAQGQAIRSPIEERVIGITLEQLRSIPRVAAVAGSTRKHHALLAVLRGRLIDVLATDQFTAMRLDGAPEQGAGS